MCGYLAAGLGLDSPGLAVMVAISVAGGAVAVTFAVGVAYVATVAAYRVGVDPDTYGVPVVTSSVDFVGVAALVAMAVAFGVLGR